MSIRQIVEFCAIGLIIVLVLIGAFYMDKSYIRYHSSALEARVADLERKTALLDLPAGTMVQVLEYPIYRIPSGTMTPWNIENIMIIKE